MRVTLHDGWTEHLINPALPELAKVLERHQRLEQAAGRLSTAVSIAVVSGIVGVFVGLVLLDLAAEEQKLTGDIFAVVGIAALVLSIVFVTVKWRRESAARQIRGGLIDSGDALPLKLLDAFSVGDCSGEAEWEALGLIHDARIHDKRVAWAKSAQPKGQLVTEAHETLIDVEDAARAMFQRAADLLDPKGEYTNLRLREHVR